MDECRQDEENTGDDPALDEGGCVGGGQIGFGRVEDVGHNQEYGDQKSHSEISKE